MTEEKGDIATLFRGNNGDYLSPPVSARDNIGLPILGLHIQVQQQLLGGTTQKSEEGLPVLGEGDEGTGKDGSDSAGMRNDV